MDDFNHNLWRDDASELPVLSRQLSLDKQGSMIVILYTVLLFSDLILTGRYPVLSAK